MAVRKGRFVRYIGIVCWFLALFVLIHHAQEKKREEPAVIVTEAGETEEPKIEGTVVFPSEK